MPILDAVEHSLRHFVPKTHRQFIVFQIASRFEDLGNLAKYLLIADRHPRKVLIEAARLAQQHARQDHQPAPVHFFALLDRWREEGT